ncbi:MAG: hypothetical protein ACK53A_01815, partial [Gemmatimonadota bacterium]
MPVGRSIHHVTREPLGRRDAEARHVKDRDPLVAHHALERADGVVGIVGRATRLGAREIPVPHDAAGDDRHGV